MRQKIKLPAPVADIYKAVRQLEDSYGRQFTPDGHMIGSLGEVIAAETFGLKLHKAANHAGHDAKDALGNEYQIKLTAGSFVVMNAEAQRLIVMRIVSPEVAEVFYNGPGAPVWAAATATGKGKARRISLAKLERLSGEMFYLDENGAAIHEAILAEGEREISPS